VVSHGVCACVLLIDTKQNEEIMIFKNSFQGFLDGPKDTLMGSNLK